MPVPRSVTRTSGAPSCERDPDQHGRVAGRERHRVLDQLFQDPTSRRAVEARHGGSGWGLHRDALVHRRDLAGDLGDVGPLGEAGFDRGFEALHEAGQAVRSVDQAVQDLSAFLGRRRAFGQRLRHAQHHGDRGAELVAQS